MSGSVGSWSSTTTPRLAPVERWSEQPEARLAHTTISGEDRTATLTSTGRWMSPSTPDRIELLRGIYRSGARLHRDVIGLDRRPRSPTRSGLPCTPTLRGRLIAPTTILTRLIITDRPPWYEDLRRGTMFHAGERYIIHREILVGSELEWDGTLETITSKDGRSGRLWFVQSHYGFATQAILRPSPTPGGRGWSLPPSAGSREACWRGREASHNPYTS